MLGRPCREDPYPRLLTLGRLLSRTPLYYTRCPVPTASGVAFQTGMFADGWVEVSGIEAGTAVVVPS